MILRNIPSSGIFIINFTFKYNTNANIGVCYMDHLYDIHIICNESSTIKPSYSL